MTNNETSQRTVNSTGPLAEVESLVNIPVESPVNQPGQSFLGQSIKSSIDQREESTDDLTITSSTDSLRGMNAANEEFTLHLLA